jgi:hypothetical protein
VASATGTGTTNFISPGGASHAVDPFLVTVSAQLTPQASAYIAQQEEHHRIRTFQEEYVEFLKRGMVEYDENYLW